MTCYFYNFLKSHDSHMILICYENNKYIMHSILSWSSFLLELLKYLHNQQVSHKPHPQNHTPNLPYSPHVTTHLLLVLEQSYPIIITN